MEELKKVSAEEKQAFKKHYNKMHRAFEKLNTRNVNHRPPSKLISKNNFD